MEFFVLKERVNAATETIAESTDPYNTENATMCNSCGKYVGLMEWVAPYNVKVRSKVKGDFIFVDYRHLLVSRNVMDCYKSEGLKGIVNFHAVSLFRTNGKDTQAKQDFFKVDIVRSGVRVDSEKSEIVRDFTDMPGFCSVCLTGGVITDMRGLVLDATKWNGEDIFFPTGSPSTYVVSRKFVEMVQRYELTNAFFVKAEDFRYSYLTNPYDEA